MKRILIAAAAALLLPLGIFAQCTLANFTAVANLGPGNFPYNSASGNVTVNVAAPGVPTLGNTSYTCNGQTFACAANSWWPNTTAHIITVSFSAPVAKFSVIINGTNQGEIFTFTPNAGSVTLSDYCSAGFSTVAANQLIDNIVAATGTLITINNPAGATSYTITHNGVGSGSRLSIPDCFVRATPFAADMQAFDVNYRPDLHDVKLDWQTLSESNLRGFEVQHSLDGEIWSPLDFVDAAGTSTGLKSYDFVHGTPVPGANYYRLRKVDVDANYSFSEVRLIEIALPGTAATIFPNPTSGKFEVRSTGRIGNLEVTDMLGREILRMSFDSQAALDLGDQAPGVYWVKIVDQDRRVSNQRIVLQ